MRCPCGAEHPAESPTAMIVARLVEMKGETVVVHVDSAGSWEVPRAYIGWHGLKAQELPALAERYGWPRVASYTCRHCGRVSWNPGDAIHRFCGVCGFEDGSGK